MPQLATLKNYIEGPKWANVTHFLYDLSIKFHCDLEILNHEKGLISETVYFQFSGYDNNLRLINRAIIETVEKYNETPYYGKTYKAKKGNIEIDNLLNIAHINISVNKLSHVKDLIEDLAEHMDVRTSKIKENNNGFLKGKSVKTAVYFPTKISMEKFLNIFENHLKFKDTLIMSEKNHQSFKI